MRRAHSWNGGRREELLLIQFLGNSYNSYLVSEFTLRRSTSWKSGAQCGKSCLFSFVVFILFFISLFIFFIYFFLYNHVSVSSLVIFDILPFECFLLDF